MSVQHMPTPPDRPTNQSAPAGVETQAPASDAQQPEQAAAKLPLGEDMARVLEDRIEVIVQRQVYHSQMMIGVSATGTDPVNARNAVLAVASALRSGSSAPILDALVNLGDPQLAQVNDHTLPFRFNAQVAGLFEGILLDTFSHAYAGDSDRERDARAALERLFIDANEQAERQHKAQLAFLAPGPHPNARR